MAESRPFNKRTVLDSLSGDKMYPEVSEFLATSNVSTHAFTDEQHKELCSINDPIEFAVKYLELAVSNWFRIVRGE